MTNIETQQIKIILAAIYEYGIKYLAPEFRINKGVGLNIQSKTQAFPEEKPNIQQLSSYCQKTSIFSLRDSQLCERSYFSLSGREEEIVTCLDLQKVL